MTQTTLGLRWGERKIVNEMKNKDQFHINCVSVKAVSPCDKNIIFQAKKSNRFASSSDSYTSLLFSHFASFLFLQKSKCKGLSSHILELKCLIYQVKWLINQLSHPHL